MSTLRLIVKKKWFDMISSGEKKEEYRSSTVYWLKRLSSDYIAGAIVFKQFDTVTFVNGYQKDSPKIEVELKGIEHRCGFRNGKPEWGAVDGDHYFVLTLGDRITK